MQSLQTQRILTEHVTDALYVSETCFVSLTAREGQRVCVSQQRQDINPLLPSSVIAFYIIVFMQLQLQLQGLQIHEDINFPLSTSP